MCGARGIPLALLLVCGCTGMSAFTGPTTSMKPATGPFGPDAVGLEVAVIEVPVGDRYVNSGLWATIDEQVVNLDHKAALDDNGLRVGLIGGMRPSAVRRPAEVAAVQPGRALASDARRPYQDNCPRPHSTRVQIQPGGRRQAGPGNGVREGPMRAPSDADAE